MTTTNALDIDDLREQGRYSIALVGGGCFWCMQGPFDAADGVLRCIAGYSGGETPNPDYQSVCSGQTGHVEVMLIVFDAEKISYSELLDIFWRNIDPTQVNGQFADHGSQYKTVIFYLDDEQKETALRSRDQLQSGGRFDQPIATEILPAAPFYSAEEYHQDYYRKNPVRYKNYHSHSGREGFIKSAWSA